MATSVTQVMGAAPTRSFAQRLGGRWALSVPGYVITFVLALAGMSADLIRLDVRDASVLFGGMIAVCAMSAVIDVALHRTRWSRRHVHPVPRWEVLGRVVLTGVMFAVCFAALRRWFDVDIAVGSAQGFVVYPAAALWVCTTVIVYLDVIDQARSLRRSAIEVRSQSLEVIRDAESVVLGLRSQVAAMVGPEMDRLRMATAGESPSEIASQIRAVVDRSVRRLSHDLWRRVDGVPSRIRVREVARGLLLRPTLRPWPIIGVSVIVPVFGDPDLARPMPVLVGALAAGAILVESWFANRLVARHPSWHLAVVLGVIAVFVTQARVVDMLAPRWGQEQSGVGVVGVFLGTVLLVAAASAIGSYRALDDERAQALASEIRADRFDAAASAHLIAEESRRLAGVLHGTVQSRLLGCAMALDLADGDPALIREALDRTEQVLVDEWYGEGGDPFERIRASWSGVADVVLTGDTDAFGSDAPAIAEVVGELVNNAVRHGGARRVDIRVDEGDQSWDVTVSDDGSSSGAGHPGLGSRLIERHGVMERHSSPDGWVVSVEVPRREV